MTSTWPKTEVLSVTPPSPPAVATWRSKPSPTEPNQTVCSYVAVTVGVLLLWIAGTYGLSRDVPAFALLWGAPVGGAALLAARSARSGFLARAYSRSGVMVGVTCQLAPTFGVCVVTLSSCSMSK